MASLGEAREGTGTSHSASSLFYLFLQCYWVVLKSSHSIHCFMTLKFFQGSREGFFLDCYCTHSDYIFLLGQLYIISFPGPVVAGWERTTVN